MAERMVSHIPIRMEGIDVCVGCLARPRARGLVRAWAGEPCHPHGTPSETVLKILAGGEVPAQLGAVPRGLVERWIVRARACRGAPSEILASKEA